MPDERAQGRKPWRQPWNTNGLKRLTQWLTIVGVIGSGAWAFELRYAKAEDLRQHVGEHHTQSRQMQAEFLRYRLDATEQRIFELERALRLRALTSLETERLDELRRQRRDIMNQIEALESHGG